MDERQQSGVLAEGDLAEIRSAMLRFARLQLRDEAAAEDAVQEALAAALVNADKFAGRASARTWVFSILRNKIVDVIRTQSRSINVSSLMGEGASFDETFDSLFKASEHWQPQARPRDWGDPETSLSEQQFWAVFDACLDHLPEKTARVFMMREFLELESGEICQELAISTDNLYVILHRARNSLRLCLDQSWFVAGEARC
ncbi:MAG TPA: sigma-70 family RNA polymerase sigma factor [Rhodocyclaceae bacterium]